MFIFIFFVYCNNKHSNAINFNNLLKKYAKIPSDSIKLNCVKFIKDNLDDLSSAQVIFYSTITGEEIDIRLDTISSKESLDNILSNQHLAYRTKIVSDSLVITNNLLEKNIEKAVEDWNKYPWSKNIPQSVFLNYLLPYKVLDENPENWRSYFYDRYKDTIARTVNNYFVDTTNKYLKDPVDMYYKIVVNEESKWFQYKDSYTKLSPHPSLSELMCMKQGNCYNSAYLNTYILRSLGIPSTIDFVPLWGSRNGSHAVEVFWDSKNKMITAGGRSLNRPAKVFRVSFKKQNIWKDSIQPLVGNALFLLPRLQNNHWLDVTNEHTPVTDINYHLPDSMNNVQYAYICVFDFGEWQPVFWGKVNKYNNALFKEMGCNILYQIAIPNGDSCKLIGKVFMVDGTGKILNKTPDYNDYNKKVNMVLRRLNTGSRSYVEKDKRYELHRLDNNNIWLSLGIYTCTKDSVIEVKNMLSNGLYRLLEVDGDKRLERPFTYENNLQIWW